MYPKYLMKFSFITTIFKCYINSGHAMNIIIKQVILMNENIFKYDD